MIAAGEQMTTSKTIDQAEKHRVMIVDDHPILRQGMAQLINQSSDLLVCAQAGTIAEAVAAVQENFPEIALVDISLRDESGLDLIPMLKAKSPGLAILVLSIYDEPYYASRALNAGAAGYLTKQEAAEKIFSAIRHVLAGDIYLSDKIRKNLKI
jgi:two-component system, NarL family, response regulator FusR